MLRTSFFTILLVLAAALTALILLLPTEPKQSNRAATERGIVAFENVRLFDGETFTEGASIVIEDGLITAAGRNLDIPDGAEIVGGGGKTLLPGLIDAHTHDWGPALEDSARFGVTAVLDMFSDPGFLAAQKARRDDPASAAPAADMFGAGMLATAPGGHGAQYGVAVETLSSPEDAPGWVARRAAEGSDYVKLVYIPNAGGFPTLDRETAAAVIDAAHEAGLMVVAHISSLQGAEHMVDEGIDGLVHIFGDAPVSEAFINAAAAADIFIIPTLSVIAAVDGGEAGATLAADPAIAPFLTPSMKASLEAAWSSAPPGYNYDIAAENVARLHRAGIDMLAGSDAPNSGTAHGASLHSELEFLVDAGLSPEEALAAATSIPARRFGLEGRGRIAPGLRADLVLIEGDPTSNIARTRDIVAVYKNGRAIGRDLSDSPASAGLASPLIADFETGLETQEGGWGPSDDTIVGGGSSAAVSWISPGADGSAGALHVEAEVKPDFIAPWAGAAYGYAPDLSESRELTGLTHLVFEARGEPGPLRAMMFNRSGASAGPPPEQSFAVNADWATVRLPLSGFRGLDPANFAGLAIVAGPAPGTMQFDLDNVRFE